MIYTHWLLWLLLPFSKKSRSFRIPFLYFLISSFNSRFSFCFRKVFSTSFCLAIFLCCLIFFTFSLLCNPACFSNKERLTYNMKKYREHTMTEVIFFDITSGRDYLSVVRRTVISMKNSSRVVLQNKIIWGNEIMKWNLSSQIPH